MNPVDWASILEIAAAIVTSYDTGVTLRQLFYRLVAKELLVNTRSYYKRLSERTAQARRAGSFPALEDRTRTIHRWLTFGSPQAALLDTAESYVRDRTEGQEWKTYIGVEKHGLVNQLMSWFAPLGLPVLALGGYSSQTFVDEVRKDAEQDGRPSALLYAGDFDPSGVDIDRDFVKRTGCFTEVVRVALTAEQVTRYDLPPQMGKSTDSRAATFVEKHGQLVQVELDALPPNILQMIFAEALEPYWDESSYDRTIEIERSERGVLIRLAQEWAR